MSKYVNVRRDHGNDLSPKKPENFFTANSFHTDQMSIDQQVLHLRLKSVLVVDVCHAQLLV